MREEADNHINYLELLAGFFALKTFITERTAITVLLRMDHVIAIAYVNRMGGRHSKALSNLAVDLWKRCLHRKILTHVEHLPSRENIRTDLSKQYRTINDT